MLALVHPYRAWADIDLDAIAHNIALIRRRVGPGVGIMLVVKADAYGHGAVAVAHHAVRCGVESLGVGTCGEALELRQAGVTVPILVLGTIVDEEVIVALGHDIQLGLHSTDRAQMLQRTARRLGVIARVHLNVDTGMGRLGVLPERALELLRRLKGSSHVELAGVMTHMTAPDGALSRQTTIQIRTFEELLRDARKEDLLRGQVHVANSACIFTGLRPIHDVVRPGIGVYGVLPRDIPDAAELRPALSLRSQVVFLKDIREGARIGYDSTWEAMRSSRIATLPVGYDDGVPWRLSNRGAVLVRGRRAPIVGRVSMDYTTVDVTEIPGVRVGDLVTLIGRDGAEEISAEEVAREAGTITYEVTCSVGKRVQRVYRHGDAAGNAPVRRRATRAVRIDEPAPPAS
jgi:alanine racemase